MEQKKMDLAFANELWNKFMENANTSGLINLAYKLERDEEPFHTGDGPRHPDAWLRYLLFRNQIEGAEMPLLEATIYSQFECTVDADTTHVSFLVFPAPVMPEENEEDENESDDDYYMELPDEKKLAVMSLYDEAGEDTRLIKALEKNYASYLILMNAADKDHFNEYAEIVRHYKKNSSVLFLGRNLSVTELDWFREEFNG